MKTVTALVLISLSTLVGCASETTDNRDEVTRSAAAEHGGAESVGEAISKLEALQADDTRCVSGGSGVTCCSWSGESYCGCSTGSNAYDAATASSSKCN